jgi:putative endonuclease
MATRNEIGRSGEDLAAAWYEAHGFEVVARNWRVRQGEIDLILAAPGLVVFCEVKRRSSGRYGTGAEAVNWRKQQRIRTVALHWLGQLNQRVADIRFDVAQVDGDGTVDVIEGCF